MSRCKIEIAVALVLESSLHNGVGFGLAGWLDARTLLDAQRQPYIAGSTLKGRWRYYLRSILPAFCTENEAEQVLNRIFGKENQSGALTFGNLQLSRDWQLLLNQMVGQTNVASLLTQPRTNVMLSRLRGVALEQHLFTVETVPNHFSFEGSVSGFLELEDAALVVATQSVPRDLAYLVAAGQALTHLGGRKSRGLGRCQLQIKADGLRINDHPIDWQPLLEALL